MRRTFCMLFLTGLFFAPDARGQQPVVLSGAVLQSDDGAPLPAALLSLSGAGSRRAATDSNGRFELRLPPGRYSVTVSHVGFRTRTLTFNLSRDTSFTVPVESEARNLETVVVRSNDNERRVLSTQTSLETVDRSIALQLPAILGEVDVIKVFQLKPGVKNSGEGTSGLSVRGGGTDQNLFLFDGTPVYNPAHLFGFFSTFNIDAVRNVQLYKAGFPAEFSGRLSSIVNVNSLPGTDSALSFGGGIGLIASRLNLQGNLLRRNKEGKKLTFNVAARRTYADLFTRAINNANKNDSAYNPIPDYYFYDFNARIDYKPNEKDALFASVYHGRDFFSFSGNSFGSNFNWGNTAASLHWRRQINSHLSTTLSGHYAHYNYALRTRFDRFTFQLGSGVREYLLNQQFTYDGLRRHQLKAGYSASYNRFQISQFNISSTQANESLNSGERLGGTEMGFFVSDVWDVNATLTIDAGARFTLFRNGITYSGLEPRLSIRQLIGPDFSVKASYARMQQYKHLVASSGASLPTDIWYPSTPGIRPEVSDQVALSLSWNHKGKWLITNETYYKWMRRLVDYRPGASLFVNSALEEEFVFGQGDGYGNEITIEKTAGRLKGWIGYTLAWTTRRFPDVNEGRRFFPRFDRRHELSAVALYPISKRLTFSGSWTFYTGNAVTLPTGRRVNLEAPGVQFFNTLFSLAPIYEERGNYRMPDYHRLDLGLVWKLRTRPGRSADLTFSAYNAYSRLNPYFISFERRRVAEGEQLPGGFVPKAVTLFPIIPSITYNFKF